MSFQLTNRDEKLLALLGQYGCVSSERIKSAFWNQNPRSTIHYRRIRKLKKAGFVEDVAGDHGRTIGFFLSKKGRSYIRQTQPHENLLVHRRSYKTQFEHDQLLIDVERILAKSPIVSGFKHEAVVRRELLKGKRFPIDWPSAPRIPDTMMQVLNGDRQFKVAIELEYSDKSKARVKKMFRQHLLSRDWDIGFFIARDEKMLKRLKALLEDTKATDASVRVATKTGGVYFCLLQNLLQLRLDCPWSNERQTITLAGLAGSSSAS